MVSVIVKVVFSIIAVVILGIGISCSIDEFERDGGIPTLVAGIGFVLCMIFAWAKKYSLFKIIIPLFVVLVVISILLRIKINKEENQKETLNKDTFKNYSWDVLSMAYYFLSEDLVLLKKIKDVNTENSSGKVIVTTSKTNNKVLISKEIWGKIIEVKDNIVKVQFDKDQSACLFFESDEDGDFRLKVDENETLTYSSDLYHVDSYSHPFVKYKLQESVKEKTISSKAKGAW